MVARDTEYYLANIGNVDSIEDFFDDYRLYSYAMKAYGLEDMTYAKAFMRKVLEEGVSKPDSFANKLVDKRYAEFARAFNFADKSAQSASAIAATADQYAEKGADAGKSPGLINLETMYYRDAIKDVKSVDDLLNEPPLYYYVLEAYGLENYAKRKELVRDVLTSDLSDPRSAANQQSNPQFRAFAEAFNFGKSGNVSAQTRDIQVLTTEKFVRQTMEEDAGAQNEGVRLALYFERKAPSFRDAYSVLADPALLQVMQTALGLPAQTGQMPIEKQAALFESRVNFADFKDPQKLKDFLTRFTSLWEVQHGSVVTPNILISQPAQVGISADTLMTLQGLRLGGR